MPDSLCVSAMTPTGSASKRLCFFATDIRGTLDRQGWGRFLREVQGRRIEWVGQTRVARRGDGDTAQMIFGKTGVGRDIIRKTLEDANVPCSVCRTYSHRTFRVDSGSVWFFEVQVQHTFIRNESRWDAALTKYLRSRATAWARKECRACSLAGCFYYVFPEYSLNYPTLPTLPTLPTSIKQSKNDCFPRPQPDHPGCASGKALTDTTHARMSPLWSDTGMCHTRMYTNNTNARLSTIFPASDQGVHTEASN